MAKARLVLLILALTLATGALGQLRPKVAWTEPGAPPAYGFLRLTSDGAAQEEGEPVTWRWVSVAPDGLYAVYVPDDGPHLVVRDLTSGVDQELTELRQDARSQIRRAVWEGTVLWLVVLEDGVTNALYAVDPKVPAAVRASGRYSIASFTPVAGSDVAYAVAAQGPDSQYQSLLLCRSDGAPPRVLGDRQLVVGGRIVEDSHRVAFFGKRPDRAGMVLNVYDRELDEEFMLNPGAEAFLPVFGPGFEAVAYTTRQGIAYQGLVGEPRLLMKHLPDRRFAWGYWFTPDAQHVILEVPAQADRATRRFVRVPVNDPAGLAALFDAPGDGAAGASRVTFLPSRNSALVVVPQGDSTAPDGVYLLDVEAGTARSLGSGTLVDALASPSGRTLALAMQTSAEPEEAEIDILVLDVSAPQLSPSLTVRGTRSAEGLSARGLTMAFSPTDERLLIKATAAGETGTRAFLVNEPGQAAAPVPGGYIVHEARWARSGDALLISAVVGYTANHAPLLSLVAMDATAQAGSERLVSGSHRITDLFERPDGGLTAVFEARKATRKLIISTRPDETLVVSSDLAAAEPVWSPDGQRLLFGEQVAPGYSAVYAVEPGVEPILVSGDVLVSERPLWLSDSRRALLVAPGTAAAPGSRGYLGHAAGGAPASLGVMERVVFVPGTDRVLYRAPGPPAGVYVRDLSDPPSDPVLVAEGYDGAAPDPTGERCLVFREAERGLEAAVAPLSAGPVTPLAGTHRYLVWSPNGASVASIATDGEPRVVIFSADGTPRAEVPAAVAAVAFSPDGGRLAGVLTAPDGPAITVLWDLTGQELGRVPWPDRMRPMSSLDGALFAGMLPTSAPTLAWSSDGTRTHVVGLSEDGLVEMRTILWEERANMPSVFAGSLSDFAWSPDGSHLAALTYRVVQAPGEDALVDPPQRLTVMRGNEGRAYNASGDVSPDGFTWLTDGRLALWSSSGIGRGSVGTFVVNPDGTGLFPIAPQPGTVWPSAPRESTSQVRYTPGRPGP